MAKRSKKKKARSSVIPAKAAGASTGALRLPSWLGHDWVWGLILAGAVILAYLPVWHAGIIWDDAAVVTANPVIVGPLGLKEIWTTSAADICPLTLTTFWVEHLLWGLAPVPYHLVNVFMHAACAVVLWQVLRSLRVPGAWLGAALWALHPVEVESVAWISEMKNTQSGLFFLLSILFFVRWLKARDLDRRAGGGWNYALTLLFAALAMASKSSAVILPVVLCLCAWWMESRWDWRNLARVAPIFFISVVAGIVSIWTQQIHGANDPLWTRTWPERLVTAGDAVWFYLGKLLWPHPLILIYPRWQIDAGQLISYLPLCAVIVALFILWLKRDSWFRPGFLVFAYFLTALLPVLGLVDMSYSHYSFVADHFQYLASMGPLALAGAGLSRLADFVTPGKYGLRSSLCAGLLLALGVLSWQRVWAFESEKTLWSDTLAKNPNCSIAHSGLGAFLLEGGKWDEAIAQYEEALEINPNYAETHNNLANALLQKGRVDEAIAEYQKALEINPNVAETHYNLGNTLLQKGRVDEAIVECQKALEINPNYADAHAYLGSALLQKGHVDAAIAEYQKAMEINPNYAGAHYNLGNALLQKGQVDEAIAEYEKALEINPNYPEAHANLGSALLQKGHVDEAIVQYQKALEINPNYAEAHYNLGNVLVQKGQVDAAIAHYQKALEINPNYAEAHANLGSALLLKGHVDEAMAHYQKALEINPNVAETHYNLGNAFLQKGQVDEAIAEYQKALEINPNYAEAHTNLGNALLQKGRVDEAIAHCQKALEINPNLAAGHYNLGNAFFLKERLEEAISEYKKALRLKPDFSEAQNNLAKVQAMAGQKAGHP